MGEAWRRRAKRVRALKRYIFDSCRGRGRALGLFCDLQFLKAINLSNFYCSPRTRMPCNLQIGSVFRGVCCSFLLEPSIIFFSMVKLMCSTVLFSCVYKYVSVHVFEIPVPRTTVPPCCKIIFF